MRKLSVFVACWALTGLLGCESAPPEIQELERVSGEFIWYVNPDHDFKARWAGDCKNHTALLLREGRNAGVCGCARFNHPTDPTHVFPVFYGSDGNWWKVDYGRALRTRPVEWCNCE